MYYLQSRYYDAKICRFVNADSIDGLGLAAKAKASVISGRVTTEVRLHGWEIEFGVSGDLFSVGAEAMIGVFPNEGFTAKASVGAGLFRAGFVFRIKQNQ